MESVTKDMGITHDDFWRIIPAVFGGRAWTRDGDTVTAAHGGGRVFIRLAPEGRRRIAMFNLPSTLVTLEFHQVGPAAREAFIAVFDRRFQRGGG